MMVRDTTKASELVHLSQACMDVANLLYTVSENAGALYTRYVEAEQQIAAEGATVSEKCADVLRKMTPAKK